MADGLVERFDAVLLATGHLTKPMHAPELERFGEGYLHAHYYREPEPFVGKRICVVGVGNSACDIASDVCVTSRRTALVARSGVTILPKLLFGRAFTDITAQIQRPWIPRKLRQKMVRALVWLAHGDMTKLGFKRSDTLSHVTSSGTVTTDIAYRRIFVKQGIEAVDGHTIRFVDGTAEEFDTLIAATGYRIDLDILPPEVARVEDNQLDLCMRIAPPGWPGLFLMGFFNTDTALNMVFEHQARWVREHLLGNAGCRPMPTCAKPSPTGPHGTKAVTAQVPLWRAQVSSGNQACGRVCVDSTSFFGTAWPTDLIREARPGQLPKASIAPAAGTPSSRSTFGI